MMTRHLQLGLLAGALIIAPISTSAAQRGDRGQGRPNREQLEQRFRMRLATLLKTQLGLTDDQMRQLSEVNQRFDRQRRDLNRREIMARRTIRDEVLRQDSADVAKIEQLMADQFRIERERIDLTEAEQRELARFLTPVQRAKYLGVQEQVRREMDQIRGRGMPGMPGPNDGRGTERRRPPPG